MPAGFKVEVYASGLTDDEPRIVSKRLAGLAPPPAGGDALVGAIRGFGRPVCGTTTC